MIQIISRVLRAAFWDHFYAALLHRRGPHIASHSVCLSVCLSVCPSVPLSLPSVTWRYLANYNDTRAEGRISYGHLGRTNLFLSKFVPVHNFWSATSAIDAQTQRLDWKNSVEAVRLLDKTAQLQVCWNPGRMYWMLYLLVGVPGIVRFVADIMTRSVDGWHDKFVCCASKRYYVRHYKHKRATMGIGLRPLCLHLTL